MSSSYSNSTVLVVEDEPIILLDAMETVADAGFITLAARTAAQAIEVLETHPEVSILFTDFNLLDSTTGLDLARMVRERWPQVAILITSGTRTLSVSEMPDGAVFLTKPYLARTVIATMHKAFANSAT